MGVRNRAFEGLEGRHQGGGDFQQAFTSDEKVELWVCLGGGGHASVTAGLHPEQTHKHTKPQTRAFQTS